MAYRLGLIIFIIGLIGYISNRRNILFILLAIELMLLGVAYLFIYLSLFFDDITSLTYALYVLVLAGAEASVGLGLLIKFNRKRGGVEYR